MSGLSLSGLSRAVTFSSATSRAALPHPEVAVHYRSAGALLLAYASRLSRGELFLEADEPLPLGMATRLRLQAPGAPPLRVEGRVAWVRKVPRGPALPAGMGIALPSSFGEPMPAGRPAETGSRAVAQGAIIDRLAMRFHGFRMLALGADTTAHAAIGRYVRSLVTCDFVAAPLPASDTRFAAVIAEAELDLVFVDLDHHQRNAISVIERLMASPSLAGVPIVALAQQERNRVIAASLGVNDVLGTPPAFSEVRAVVLHGLTCPTAWDIV